MSLSVLWRPIVPGRGTVLLHAAIFAFVLGSLSLGCRRAEISCPEAEDGPAWFEDITEKVGLTFIHDAGPVDGRYFMPQSNGSGAAMFDFDGDGRLDIYLLHCGGPNGKKNQLFKQLPDGTFKDVSAGSGLDIAGYNMGVAIADVNNDGKPDVLVTQYCGIKLFLNNGNGTFTDVTRQAGLDNPNWATSAAFVDYDRDGWLDLVVVNYLSYDPTRECPDEHRKLDYCGPTAFEGRVTRLFHNLGRDRTASPAPSGGPAPVRFNDVTESSGLGSMAGPGLGVVCADFDGDGWLDIFVANDGKPNHLWINQRNGTFKEEAVLRGIAYNNMGQAHAGMGIALGDVDGDGLFDLFVTHQVTEYNAIWRQGPRGLFHDDTRTAGLLDLRQGTGWGTVLDDFDNDGALDLALVNGHVKRPESVRDWSLGEFWSWYGDCNRLFRNTGKGQFKDISPQNRPFCSRYNVARGLVRGDIDADGGVDLLVTTIAGPARLFRNVVPDRGRYLQVRAFDPALQRDALGAEIRVRAGDRTWVSLLQTAGSYLCAGEAMAHFGLGTVSRVDAIEVLWPDGAREIFPGCDTNRRHELRKGSGRKVAQ
jgi:hypothetical protein